MSRASSAHACLLFLPFKELQDFQVDNECLRADGDQGGSVGSEKVGRLAAITNEVRGGRAGQ